MGRLREEYDPVPYDGFWVMDRIYSYYDSPTHTFHLCKGGTGGYIIEKAHSGEAQCHSCRKLLGIPYNNLIMLSKMRTW